MRTTDVVTKVVVFAGALLLSACVGPTSPPRITTHPSDQTVTECQTATFTVTATGGGTLTYGWRKDGTDIPGATGATYEISQTTVLDDDGANFTCVVSNAYGTAESNTAALTVIAPALWINGLGQSVAGELTAAITVRFQGSYGSPVTNADVTLNGISIPYDGSSRFFLAPIVGINPGDDVTLRVIYGFQDVSATVLMPAEPFVTSPTPVGSPYDALLPIPVQWTAASPSPDRVGVSAYEQLTFYETGWSTSGVGWSATLDGAETGTEIPAGTLSAAERQLPGSDTVLLVYAANRFENIDLEANLMLSVYSLNVGAFTTQD